MFFGDRWAESENVSTYNMHKSVSVKYWWMDRDRSISTKDN